MRLFAEAQYGEACEQFEASLALVPGMGTRGKLAECYEKVGRTAIATDPRPLSIEASAKSHHSQTLTVALGSGDRIIVDISVLIALPVAAPPDPDPVVAMPPQPDRVAPRNTRRIVGISSVAVGGGALVLAAVLSVNAKGDYDGALTMACATRTTRAHRLV